MSYLKLNLLKTNKYIVLIGIALFLVACDRVFEFSPYEANVKEENNNTTAKNLKLLKDIQVETNKFKFAFITDTHTWYNNLRAVVDDINKRDDILFVIFGGDVADQGLLKEYELFYNIVEKLDKPYLTVIGNHDYKSNGGVIYKELFGDYNYSFEFSNNKFILFDDVVWESNKMPDFDWLSTELSNNMLFEHVFVIAHIPPFTDQLDRSMEETYKALLFENNASLSIHGHNHSYSYEKVYDDAVSYLTVPSLKEPAYCIVNVHNESFDIELIEL